MSILLVIRDHVLHSLAAWVPIVGRKSDFVATSRFESDASVN